MFVYAEAFIPDHYTFQVLLAKYYFDIVTIFTSGINNNPTCLNQFATILYANIHTHIFSVLFSYTGKFNILMFIFLDIRPHSTLNKDGIDQWKPGKQIDVRVYILCKMSSVVDKRTVGN